MTSWPVEHRAPEVTVDDTLLTEPYSAQVAVVKAKVSVLGYLVHSTRYTEILLEVLKYVINTLSTQSM